MLFEKMCASKLNVRLALSILKFLGKEIAQRQKPADKKY
jgi:hypothetical protein